MRHNGTHPFHIATQQRQPHNGFSSTCNFSYTANAVTWVDRQSPHFRKSTHRQRRLLLTNLILLRATTITHLFRGSIWSHVRCQLLGDTQSNEGRTLLIYDGRGNTIQQGHNKRHIFLFETQTESIINKSLKYNTNMPIMRTTTKPWAVDSEINKTLLRHVSKKKAFF